ncbi:MAG TPA: hypothetical protein VKE22_12630 [Haliangiales bacterium]|nr:hypothetical protein [Haliangiales bacterium]
MSFLSSMGGTLAAAGNMLLGPGTTGALMAAGDSVSHFVGGAAGDAATSMGGALSGALLGGPAGLLTGALDGFLGGETLGRESGGANLRFGEGAGPNLSWGGSSPGPAPASLSPSDVFAPYAG